MYVRKEGKKEGMKEDILPSFNSLNNSGHLTVNIAYLSIQYIVLTSC